MFSLQRAGSRRLPGPVRDRASILLPLLVGILAALSATSAHAHEGRHDFESVVSEVAPAGFASGLTVRMIDYDEQVELINGSGKTVVVIGYEGEPYARLEPTGDVHLNLRSPSLAPSNDRWGRTPAGGQEDAGARPHWYKVSDDGKLAWFDRRSHYRKIGVPPAVVDPAKRQEIWQYRIPLRVGGEPAEIRGTLYWAGRRPFPIGAFVFMLIATAGCAFFGAWTIRQMRARSEEVTPEKDGSISPDGKLTRPSWK